VNDFKLKLILSALGGIVFSFIFILLAFALPIHEKESKTFKKPKGKLEQISEALKNR
jgi:Na+-transporting methylmalonyl-CoA/oxaloacetate decarboxylase gamma subunit